MDSSSVAEFPARVRRVELRCSDVEASADFYRRLLGLEPGSLGSERGELGVPGATGPLLVLRRAERPGRAPGRAAGLFHTAFRYPDRAGLAGAIDRVAGEFESRLTGASDHGVSEAIYLDDPDGLGVEVYRDRPPAEWPPPAAGERIRMFTRPLDVEDVLRAGDGASAAAARGLDIGHVHLKVADLEAGIAFWTGQVGMELTTRVGSDAAFLSHDGYHHHIGVNSWLSRGAEPEPAAGPGLDAIALRGEAPAAPVASPDGVRILRVER
ncbi:MAG: VOC family protein [Thermoleophilaceae bacterium]